MRADVQTLITALRAERNSLDRAIASLEAITEGGSVVPAQASHRRSRGGPRYAIAETARREIVRAMESAQYPYRAHVARQLGEQLGVSQTTIQTKWRTWARALASEETQAGAV